MRKGMTTNAGGVGYKSEELPCMQSMVTITGGSEMQRRIQRDYSKVAHAADAKEAALLKASLLDGDDVGADISQPLRVL